VTEWFERGASELPAPVNIALDTEKLKDYAD
jgi:hypothetical protein